MTREEKMTPEEAHRILSNGLVNAPSEQEWCMAFELAIQALSQEPCTDAVSRGVFEQVMWERDIAIEQLHELGYEFGQKIEPCDECQYNHTSICGNCKRYDEFEEIDYFVQEHKKIPVTLDLTPCDDAISREAALNSLIDNTHLDGYDLAEALDAIENKEKLPSVTPQPCDEAISREAAIKTVHKMRVVCDTEDIDDYYELLVESFKQLPPVTQKSGKWIPVSERLPEEDGQYLITVKYVHVDGYDDIYAEHGEWRDGNWDMFCFGHCGQVEKILAWMPLPEPYEPQESEKINCKSTKCENCTNHNYCDFEPQKSEE